MKRRYLVKNLWNDAQSSKNQSRYLNRKVFELDKEKDTLVYTDKVFDELIEIKRMNINKNFVSKNSNFLFHILNVGKRLIHFCDPNSDLYYLGLFLEVHISKVWNNLNILNTLKKMFNNLLSKKLILSKKIKEKLLFQYYCAYPKDFSKMFKSAA